MTRRSTHDIKPLPPMELLRSIFHYKRNGQLFWKRRTVGFASNRACSIWNSRFVGMRAGYRMQTGYRLITVNNVRYLEHRIIYHLLRGPLSSKDYVDHLDYNAANNKISNLRKCSHAQNLMNQPGRSRKGLPKHVTWSNLEQKYKVKIRSHGAIYNLGTFAILDHAIKAAERGAAELHGAFRFKEARK